MNFLISITKNIFTTTEAEEVKSIKKALLAAIKILKVLLMILISYHLIGRNLAVLKVIHQL